MNLLVYIGIIFAVFALAFIGLGLSALLNRRAKPGSCAHDPTEDHEPGRDGCDVCGGDADKCCRK